jgi:hypothetical protein
VNRQARPQARRDPEGFDWLSWGIGLFGTAILAIAGAIITLRIRREMLGENAETEEASTDVMEAVREAYFEGELDSAEYQKLRRKLNPAAQGEIPAAEPPSDTDQAPPASGDPQ